ncbi:MAG: hypothetical protein WKH68_08130, partial [Candidatus Limnocylindria bacterium]
GCGGAEAPVRTVEGLVLEVVGDSPADIEAFTLRTDEGEALRFSLGAVDSADAGFPASHLREHQALAEPIRVTYRREGETNVVVRLDDAE